MNNKIAVRKCKEYDVHEVYALISDIYKTTDGPDVHGKRVLVKPNILTDSDPAKCISTHPVVVEAMIRFLQSNGATVLVGDSPAVHTQKFRGEKSGIYKTCETTGAEWVDFTLNPIEKKLERRPVFIHENCTGCQKCVSICPVQAIHPLPSKKTHIVLTDSKCIRCFCCSEVCMDDAVEIKRKLFGD